MLRFRNIPVIVTKLVSCIVLVNAMSGCKSTQFSQSDVNLEQYIATDLFVETQLAAVETPEQIFYLNKAAKEFVDQITELNIDENEQLKLLVTRIFDRSNLDMLYSADANTIASETFEKAAANCMSLSIMTYSMAQYAGLSSHFQVVKIPEYWTRKNGYSMLNGHINLRIKPRRQPGIYKVFDQDVVVDFDSQSRTKRFPSKLIKPERVLAMFYNNKGADYLVKKDASRAFEYFKTAVKTDPNFAGAWINLGLLYRQNDRFKLAEMAYQRAIEVDQDSLTALENLAVLYRYQGNYKASSEMLAKVASKRKKNPFFHQMLAEIEVDNNDWDKSIAHYQDAIALDDDQHMFYFGLAIAYFNKGQLDMTDRYLKKAKRTSKDDDVTRHYANKLSVLKDTK